MKTLFKLLIIVYFVGNQVESFGQEITRLYGLGKYAEALESTPMTESDFLYKAHIYELNGKNQLACQCYQMGLKQYPSSQTLKQKLAFTLKSNGDYSAALRLLEALRISEPHNLNYLLATVDIYLLKDMNTETIKLLEAFLEIDDQQVSVYTRLAKAYQQQGQNNLELVALFHALKLDPENMNLAAQVIALQYALKAYKEALETTNQYLEKDSTHLLLMKYKGLCYCQMKEYKKAIPYLDQVIQHGNQKVNVLFYAAYAHFTLGEYDAVIPLLKVFNEKQDPNPDVDYMLGYSLQITGDTLGSIAYLSRSIDELLPKPQKLGKTYFALANSYRMNHQYNEAIANYQLGFEADSVHQKQCLFFIATIYANDLKQKKKGLDAYKVFLSSLSDDDSANKATYTVSLRDVAERKVEKLTEEIFFEEGTN